MLYKVTYEEEVRRPSVYGSRLNSDREFAYVLFLNPPTRDALRTLRNEIMDAVIDREVVMPKDAEDISVSIRILSVDHIQNWLV
jgi:hypothetical protein